MRSLEEARQIILERATILPRENLPLLEGQGRILQQSTVATQNLPPWDHSAMDGFAVRACELPATLPIAGVIAAGVPPDESLPVHTCMKIMTGAPIPLGADSVVIRENIEEMDGIVRFAKTPTVGQNIRRMGEDVRSDSILLPKGTILGPGELAILAAQGISNVDVCRRPRVAILSTGDELVPLGAKPRRGQIFNSNSMTLMAQSHSAGAHVVNAGIVRDDMDATVRALRSLSDYDLLLTSGGVSVGDYDYIKKAFEEVNITILFWTVAIKPGKPLVFGVRDNGQLVLGLPGNPVSSLVSFELFGRPLLRKLMGHPHPVRRRIPVVISHSIDKQPGRTHLVRAQLHRDNMTLVATPLQKQGSGMHRSMVRVDCLLEISASSSNVTAGSIVSALMLREWA